MNKKCLVDTSAFIALYDPRDQHHEEASVIAEQLDETLFVITEAIITETYALLRYRLGFEQARQFLQMVMNEESFHIVEANNALRKQTFVLLEKFRDQKISYCDALSVAVMKEKKMHEVFTFDHHFEGMGMKRLYAK